MESDKNTHISVRDRLLRDFPKSEDFRYEYDEEFLDTYISAQIRALREDRGLTQAELAKAAGTGQSKISAMESDYHSWSLRTLRKLARAFGVRLFVTFEGWGELLPRLSTVNRKDLVRPRLEDDPVFRRSDGSTQDDAAAFTNVVPMFERRNAIVPTERYRRKDPHHAKTEKWISELKYEAATEGATNG